MAQDDHNGQLGYLVYVWWYGQLSCPACTSVYQRDLFGSLPSRRVVPSCPSPWSVVTTGDTTSVPTTTKVPGMTMQSYERGSRTSGMWSGRASRVGSHTIPFVEYKTCLLRTANAVIATLFKNLVPCDGRVRCKDYLRHNMFSAFSRRLPQISVFHNPASPPSIKALAMLRASLSAPYPPTTPDGPPLEFNLEVVESTPTPDQLRTILSYVAPKGSYTTFLSSHPAAPGVDEQPQDAAGIADLGTRHPNALKWPVVVDWTGGRASIGDVEGVAGMLEALRQRRDGEVRDEHVQSKGWFR